MAFTVVGGSTRVRVPTRRPGLLRLHRLTDVKEGNMRTFLSTHPDVEKNGVG